MDQFFKKVIIITGASAGIGRALACRLATERPKLVLAARDDTRLHAVAEVCQGLGAETTVVPTDVASPQDCNNLIQKTMSHFGAIDVLVNNAGFSMWAEVEAVQSVDLFERLIHVNYLGSVYCTKFALPYLKNSHGRIIANSSVAGLTGVPAHSGYCATKHAMMGFFDSLRIELRGTGVTVTVVAPDFVQSEIHARSLGGSGQPSGRVLQKPDSFLSAEDCADRIVDGMAQRKRMVFTSWRGKWGRWLKLMSPSLVDWMARKGVEDAYGR